jgi:hypothetical protein
VPAQDEQQQRGRQRHTRLVSAGNDRAGDIRRARLSWPRSSGVPLAALPSTYAKEAGRSVTKRLTEVSRSISAGELAVCRL